MRKGYEENLLKRFLKRRVKVTLGIVVAFLISGTIGYSKNIVVNETSSWKDGYVSGGGEVLYGGDTVTINNNATLKFDFTDKELLILHGGANQMALVMQENPDGFGDPRNTLKITGGNLFIRADKTTGKQSYAIFIQSIAEKAHINLENTNLCIQDYDYGISGNAGEITIKNNKTEFLDVRYGIYSKGKGMVNITTDNFVGKSDSCLIYAKGDSNVNIVADNINITASGQEYVAYVKENGVAKITSGSGQIIGNVATSGTGNASITMDLGNTYWKGASFPDNTHINIDILLKNKSHWEITNTSGAKDLLLENGSQITFEEQPNNFLELYVFNNMNGDNGTINMNIDASTNKDNSDRLYIDGTHTGTHYITLNNVSADGSNDGAEGTVLVSVKDEQGEFKANDKEGALFWNKYELDRLDKKEGEEVTNNYETDWYLKKTEKIDPEDKPTTDVETVVAANSLNYYTWRAENDKLMQRMGELRYNGESNKGTWFRVKHSKLGHDGDFNFENKYTSYQVGYDEVAKRNADLVRYQGVAFGYLEGDSSYRRGDGKNDHKSVSFYNTDIYTDGRYFDAIFKVTHMNNEYDVFNSELKEINGDFENVGLSLSLEYGKKYEINENWYIEPQTQLTLGYIFGDTYNTSSGIRVNQEDITSVIGRLGFNFGREMNETTEIYVKGNVLHEFDGEYKLDMSLGKDSVTMSDDFDDTWFEAGVGVAKNLTENLHIYTDAEKDFGNDVDNSWRVNIGFRYKFGSIQDFSFNAANLFDFDKSIVKPEGKEMIKNASQIIDKKKLKGTLVIEGHTDWTGTEEYNQILSEKRAKAVREEFESNITNENIKYESKGYGETKPIATNKTKEGRAKNRRVDIKYIKD